VYTGEAGGVRQARAVEREPREVVARPARRRDLRRAERAQRRDRGVVVTVFEEQCGDVHYARGRGVERRAQLVGGLVRRHPGLAALRAQLRHPVRVHADEVALTRDRPGDRARGARDAGARRVG